ncbi:MAG: choice-of-anchor I family protein, partial [Verrucomicrobiales bacterium]|nr:choice-of-anchor I family protein [Verrucomicrobiales bacterium]
LLVANEGEYIVGGPGVTPGSVSIVDVSGGFGAPPVNTVGFTAFDGQAATLKAAGVRIFGAELPSNDLEPEYIAVSPDGATAFVTLQENNAVAILNIATATFTNILPLGLKDFSTLLADFSDRDNAAGTGAMGVLKTGNPVFGLYMPDAIASFQSGGQNYYVIANEGDDRDDFLTPDETSRVSSLDLDNGLFPTETTLKQNRNLGRLTVTLRGEDGQALVSPVQKLLALGGRSFSILNAAGAMVYDSGDFIEKTIHSYGTPFHDDSRSDNKAAEPEGATVGVVNGRTLAFIGLERANGVMVFDVTDVNTPTFVSFLHHAGDVSPEGLTFVSATESPSNKALLIVTNEVSNTVTIYGFSSEVTINPTVTSKPNKDGGTVTGGGTIFAGELTTFEAIPNPGNSFARWVVTRAEGDKEFYTDAVLDIALFEGDSIEAEFARISGKFTGLVVDDPVDHATSGFVSASVTATGNLSASVIFGGQKWGYKGTLLAAAGGVATSNKSGTGPTLTVTSAVGTQIEGDVNGVPFVLEKTLWKKTSNEYDFGGLHTACLAEDMVAEYGYSLIKISAASGAATVKGQLPDGTKYTSGTVVSGVDNSLPVYGLIRGGASSLFGILIPSVVTSVTLWDGDVSVLGAIGPVELIAQGSQYLQPASGTPVIVGASDFLAAISQAAGGTPDLGFASVSLLGTLGNAPAVSTPATPYTLEFSGGEDPSSATVIFNVKTGATKFQFVHPVTGKKVTGYGAVVQHQLNGAEDGVEAGMGCGIYLVKQKVGTVTTSYPGWMAFDDVGIE